MKQKCWQITEEAGFLIYPAPCESLIGLIDDPDVVDIEAIAQDLPNLIEAGQLRQRLAELPIIDLRSLQGSLALERAFQVYSFFASGYIHAPEQQPASKLPAGIAIPLAEIAARLQRPPILSYASYTLANWKKINPAGAITVENLQLLLRFIHKRDAAWFTLIHVEIEAHAGPAIAAIPKIEDAIQKDDARTIIVELERIHRALDRMMITLKRMPEHCHPRTYYHEVRPYIFSFENVVYEGVEAFSGRPQSFVGETGAQSSVIPALVRLMGLVHEETSMTQYLRVMQNYMPEPHRAFIRNIDAAALRRYVVQRDDHALTTAYNDTLQQILAFRQLHIRYAASYIANQSEDRVGTGGTEFMPWLQLLIDETEAQLL